MLSWKYLFRISWHTCLNGVDWGSSGTTANYKSPVCALGRYTTWSPYKIELLKDQITVKAPTG